MPVTRSEDELRFRLRFSLRARMLAAMLEGCSARRPTVGRRRLRRGHFSISSTPKMSMAESSFVDGSITAQRLKQIHQSRRHQSSLEQLGTTSRKKTNKRNKRRNSSDGFGTNVRVDRRSAPVWRRSGASVDTCSSAP